MKRGRSATPKSSSGIANQRGDVNNRGPTSSTARKLEKAKAKPPPPLNRLPSSTTSAAPTARSTKQTAAQKRKRRGSSSDSSSSSSSEEDDSTSSGSGSSSSSSSLSSSSHDDENGRNRGKNSITEEEEEECPFSPLLNLKRRAAISGSQHGDAFAAAENIISAVVASAGGGGGFGGRPSTSGDDDGGKAEEEEEEEERGGWKGGINSDTQRDRRHLRAQRRHSQKVAVFASESDVLRAEEERQHLIRLMEAHSLVHDPSAHTVRCAMCTSEGAPRPYLVLQNVRMPTSAVSKLLELEDQVGVGLISNIDSGDFAANDLCVSVSQQQQQQQQQSVLNNNNNTGTRMSDKSKFTSSSPPPPAADLHFSALLAHINSRRHLSSLEHWQSVADPSLNGGGGGGDDHLIGDGGGGMAMLSPSSAGAGTDNGAHGGNTNAAADHHHNSAAASTAFGGGNKEPNFTLVEVNGTAMLLSHSVVFPDAMFGRGTTLFDLSTQLLLVPNEVGAIQLFANHRYAVIEMQLPSSESRPPSAVAPPLFRRTRRETPREHFLRKLPTVESTGVPASRVLHSLGVVIAESDPLPQIALGGAPLCRYTDAEFGSKNRDFCAADDDSSASAATTTIHFLHNNPSAADGRSDGAVLDGKGDSADGSGGTIRYTGLFPSEAQQRMEGANRRIQMERARKS